MSREILEIGATKRKKFANRLNFCPDLPIAHQMTISWRLLPLLACLASFAGCALAAQDQSSSGRNSLSLQEQSIARQMDAITSTAAQDQADSIRRQAESLRRQYGTSSGIWTDSADAGPIQQISEKPSAKPPQSKLIEDPKALSPEKPAEAQAVAEETKPVRAGFYTVPWPASPDFVMPNVQVATTACDALAPSEVSTLIKNASTKNKLDPSLLRAVMVQESGLRPCAVSTAGAMGLMQIMPDTADALGLADPYDPASNVDAGARYLKQMLDRYHGNTALALAAYNTGPGRTDQANGSIPNIAETVGYVSRILSNIPLF
jgi:soluble lytic murein transglycosylase-like protein